MKKILEDLKLNSFKLRGTFENNTIILVKILGFIFFTAIWMIAAIKIDNSAILPSPVDVLKAFKPLLLDKGLLPNAWFSIKLNFTGILEAIIIALPIGFILGLFPLFNFSSEAYINALRYLPLGALIGLFITYFGIGVTMKTNFLAFAIIVYLVPTVILRIAETKEEFEQTAYTMGASKWQIIWQIYRPDVLRRLSSDIINLVAISWTYITIAEIVNKTAGLGAMIYELQRLSKLDQAFASLLFIILIGFTQDRTMRFIDRLIYPSKYYTIKPSIITRIFNSK